MWKRDEARREEEEHKALLAMVRSVQGASTAGTVSKLEAALAAVGLPGSAPLLAALALCGHALLRDACTWDRIGAVAPLVRGYGESPAACAEMMRVLDGEGVQSDALHLACYSGHAAATAALLGAYRRAGRAQEALAAGDHRALCLAAISDKPGSTETLRLLLAEYGEPGCDAVLAALTMNGPAHVLRTVCARGLARAVPLLTAAYGPTWGRERDKLVDARLLRNIFVDLTCRDRPPKAVARYDATLAALLAALGEADCASALRALGDWMDDTTRSTTVSACTVMQRLARIPPDSALARLAVATPAAWALDPEAARALLSAPVRASVALPALLALRRLPAGVAAPVAAHLRARPWLLFAGAAAVALA
jgi:hypothetical protein